MSLDIVPAKYDANEMIGYPARLLERWPVANGTLAFHFEKPDHFVFKPGQFVDLVLPGVRTDGLDELTHTFSIASSPEVDEVVIATRMRNTPFKRSLSTLAIDQKVRIKGPMGSFTLQNNLSRPAVFLAGGIGIVPFLSMLSDVAVTNRKTPISLFYVNRYLDDAPFMETLWELESSVEHFRFFPTFTRGDGGNQRWMGETGHISREIVSRHVSDLRGCICYIAGPPAMVASSRLVLNQAGVNDDDIRTEKFAGY